MKKTEKIGPLLLLRIRFRWEGSGKLPDPILQYQRKIRSAVAQMTSRKDVSSSHFSSGKDYKGSRYHIISLRLACNANVDEVAKAAEQIVRRVGFNFNHTFSLEKRIPAEEAYFDRFSRRVCPQRNTKWKELKPQLVLNGPAKPISDYPKRLKYLSQIAQRCYRVGGNDEYHLLERPSYMAHFDSNLSDEDRKELVRIYGLIVERQDDKWYRNWLEKYDSSNAEFPKWARETSWLFSLLNRLLDEGLITGKRMPRH